LPDVLLSIKEETMPQGVQGGEPQTPGEIMRVLVVEDSPTQAHVLSLMLNGKGFQVEVCASLADVVKRLKAGGIDVILLDLSLTDSTGLATFTQVHKEAPKIPIVVFTGLDDENIAMQAMHGGAQDYLIKGQAGEHSIVRCLRYAFERSRGEKALRESEQRIRSIIENSLDAFISMDSDGKIISWNRQAEHMFGWTFDEAMGQYLSDLIVPERLRGDKTISVEQKRLRRQKYLNRRTEMMAVHHDGHEFPVELAFFSIQDEEENETLCLFVNDITERKEIEARTMELNEELERRVQSRTADLQRSNQELQQFAKIASHDLQEPIRAVEGFAKLLSKRYKDQLEGDGAQFIDFILDGAQRGQKLIQDVLEHSKIQLDTTCKAETDLNSVLKEVLANLHQSIMESQAVIEYGALPTVGVDRSQLMQLFQNLVSNAIKYRKPDVSPQIIISSDRSVDMWLFSVRDNGIGFDGQYVDKIFDMFARLHGKTEYSGTGMGLAICKKIVNTHGGEIWAQSEVGQGSIFFFTLPTTD
jgi:PAS domain S-box-containing protein